MNRDVVPSGFQCNLVLLSPLIVLGLIVWGIVAIVLAVVRRSSANAAVAKLPVEARAARAADLRSCPKLLPVERAELATLRRLGF